MDEQGPMEPDDARMRDVLLQLALLSNGRTTSFAASSGGNSQPIPSLDPGDAPHLHYARLWDAAEDGHERRRVYDAARRRLAHERRGPGTTTHVVVETRDELNERIVADGEGIPAQELAIRFRTSVTIVRKARAAAGRETEYGRAPRNGHALDRAARDAEIRRLANEDGMNARQIGIALGLSYNTVRRALGRL